MAGLDGLISLAVQVSSTGVLMHFADRTFINCGRQNMHPGTWSPVKETVSRELCPQVVTWIEASLETAERFAVFNLFHEKLSKVLHTKK
jgi:hypothetical protein